MASQSDCAGSTDQEKQPRAPRSGSAQCQCARHIVQQGHAPFTVPLFTTSGTPDQITGFRKMDGLKVKESAHCADGLRCVAQGGQGDLVEKKKSSNYTALALRRKGPQLSHARLEGPNRRARTCAPDWRRKRWRPCRRPQEATSAGANSAATTPYASSHASVAMTLLDQKRPQSLPRSGTAPRKGLSSALQLANKNAGSL